MTTNSGVDPRDQERIAAFIDQRLSAEDRQEFLKRLDEEQELYEVFVETVRYRDQKTGRPAEVVEYPTGRRRWGRIAAVAAAVAAALTPVVLLNLPAARYAPRLVADGLLGDALGDRWLDKGWMTMRGGPAPGSNEFDAAFRLGVRQVDLEVALRLGRIDDLPRILDEIDVQLASLDLADHPQLLYAELGDLSGEPALARAEENHLTLRERLGDAAPIYDLGQWVEAGILASLSRNRDLLGSRGFHKTLGRFPRQEWASSSPALDGQLDEIEDLLRVPETEMDLERLEAAFDKIVDDR